MNTTTEDWAEQLKAAARAYRRAALEPHVRQHIERREREQEARRIRREYRALQRSNGVRTCSKCNQTKPLDNYPLMPSGNPHATCRTCKAAMVREAKRRKTLGLAPRRNGRTADVGADLERLTQMASALAGTNPNERIVSEQGWNNLADELENLWLQSGDKTCISCKQVVPPTAILPPSPGNSYPGRCNGCAHIAWETNHRSVVGPLIGPLPGPRKIPMRDGTSITVAELARRVAARASPIQTRFKS